MSKWQTSILAGVLLAEAVSGGVTAGLPAWDGGERVGWVAGAELLTDEARQSAVEPLDLAPPTAEDIAAPATPAELVPEKYWQAYFGERPGSFLVDPQGLLSSADFEKHLEFLKDHAGDSAIDLFVYVFKGNQEIPGEVRGEELGERIFATGRPAAVVYYHWGAPQRSVLYLSPSLTDAVSAVEQRRALESSMMQALEKKDLSAQFEAFLVQLSIRIYWMERMLGGAGAAQEEQAAVVSTAKAREKKSATLEKLQPVMEIARRLMLPMAVVAGVLVTVLAAGWWWRRRARYRFPEWAVEPRLGGAHAAGVGAVISFASAAVSPASQRDQVPEYLRRA